jgi:hypothetical protein
VAGRLARSRAGGEVPGQQELAATASAHGLTVQCDGTNDLVPRARQWQAPGCCSHGRRRLVDAGDQIALEGST